VPGFPVIDLTQPPPGYPHYHFPQPAYDPRYEQDYDAKVRRFLQETGVTEPEKESTGSRSRTRDRLRSRERDRSRHRSRDRGGSSSKKKKRSRHGSRSRSSEKKSRKRSREKILLEDDDFARKLNKHLSGSGGEKKKSRSRSKERSRRSRKSRSKSRNKSGEQKTDRRRSRSSKRREKSVEKDGSRTGGWQPVGQNQEAQKLTGEEDSRRKSLSAKPMTNVFGSEDEVDEKKRKVPEAKKVPASGGMWIPTGEDSILDGVKEAISKLEEKQRYGDRGGPARDKWDPHRKTEETPPTSKDYDVTFDGRTGMYIRVPKQLTMAEKIAAAKMTQMDREKAKDKDVQEVEERIVRNLSTSPPRLPTKRKSLSKEKKSDRSRSRERRRSGRRSRSRSRRHRSRSKRRRSRSRGRRSRSRSREHRSRSRSKEQRRRSRSKSRSRHRSKKERTSFDKTNTIQQEISGMREETRRLQTEREAIEREKALLLAGPSTGQTSPH